MGCRFSRALAYEDKGMALTTKTFSLGDPKSILKTGVDHGDDSMDQESFSSSNYDLPHRILEEYDVIKKISDGASSRIFLVQRKQKVQRREGSVSSTEGCDMSDHTGDTTIMPLGPFVLQQINLHSMSESKRREMTKEIQLIQDTNHPNSMFVFLPDYFV